MTIEEIKEEGKVQLNVHGKIDALASTEFQDGILKAFQKSSNVILNMADVQYISSAGLRGLMIGQKTAAVDMPARLATAKRSSPLTVLVWK